LETYCLEVTLAEGGTYQDMESKLEKHTHILGRAEEQKESCQNTERRESAGTLTFWRGQRVVLIRKDHKPERGTHTLEEVEDRSGQDMESKQASRGHSHPEEGRHWDW
jgi:hypothetical protein